MVASVLLSLLQCNCLMLAENLVVSCGNPTLMYQLTDNKLDEAHTHKQYHNPKGTTIDSKGHLELCPASFMTPLSWKRFIGTIMHGTMTINGVC